MNTAYVSRGSIFRRGRRDAFEVKIESKEEPEHIADPRKRKLAQQKRAKEIEEAREKRAKEPVQRILVKWEGLSYLHVSWEEREDLETLGDPTLDIRLRDILVRAIQKNTFRSP